MGCDEVVFTLFKSGFLNPAAQDQNGNTLLHASLEHGSAGLINLLLDLYDKFENVADIVNIQNKRGDTPLHIAARKFPQTQLILDLLDLGAKTGIANKALEVVDFGDDEATNDASEDEEETRIEILSCDAEESRSLQTPEYPGWLELEMVTEKFNPSSELLNPF